MIGDSWLQIFTEVGAFAMVAWLVYYTFSKTLPQMHEVFRSELQQERQVTERGFRQLNRSIEKLTTFLLYHDASVRGQTKETEEIAKLFRNGDDLEFDDRGSSQEGGKSS